MKEIINYEILHGNTNCNSLRYRHFAFITIYYGTNKYYDKIRIKISEALSNFQKDTLKFLDILVQQCIENQLNYTHFKFASINLKKIFVKK